MNAGDTDEGTDDDHWLMKVRGQQRQLGRLVKQQMSHLEPAPVQSTAVDAAGGGGEA